MLLERKLRVVLEEIRFEYLLTSPIPQEGEEGRVRC
jgi:hypothetical protein